MAPGTATMLDEARQLLDTLFGDAPEGTYVEIRMFAENTPTRQVFLTPGGEWDLRADWDGAVNVCYGICLRSTRGGKATDVHSAVALWVDDAKRPLPEGFPEPSITIETSPGNFQWLWLLNEPTTALDRVERMNERLNFLLDADHTHDRARVLRLPGYLNVKPEHPDRPRARIAHMDGAMFTLDQLEALLPEVAPASKKSYDGPYEPHEGPPISDRERGELLQAFVGWGLRQNSDGRYAGSCPLPHQGEPCSCENAFYASPVTGYWTCFCSDHEGRRPGDERVTVSGGPNALLRLARGYTHGTNGRKPDGDIQGSEQSARQSQSTKLVAIALEEQVKLWHTPDSDVYVTFDVEGHKEHWPISSKSFRRWLSYRYYCGHGGTPNAQATQDAISVLAGKALYEGKEHSVHTRVCETNGIVYLDLADSDWRAVQISKDGWQVVDNPGVKFRRSRGTLALPEPVRGGKLNKLQNFINVATDGDWVLIVAWLVTAIRGTGPFAVLTLGGEHGSAKSTLERVLRSLIDPNSAPLRSEPKEPRDLMIAATNSWVVALDNISHLPVWLSDALCRLSTGGGFTTRELYTDGDEYIFDAQRPVILNGINDVIQRSDLLDRRVNVDLPMIEEGKRLTERDFWERFERVRPQMLGALLDAVVESLRMESSVVMPAKPRMADFAMRAVAAESKFGVKAGTFMEAYTGNRAMAHDQAIDASPIGPHLRQLAEKGFVGTATELLARLNGLVDDNIRRSKEWPTRANVVSGIVRRLAPNLRAVGVMVVMGRSGDRFIEIRKVGENIVQTVQTVQTDTKPTDDASSKDRRGIVQHRPYSEGLRAYSDDADNADDHFPESSNEKDEERF